MSNRQWKSCPVCGASEASWEPEGDEGGFIVSCTNLCCASNGGDNISGLAPELLKRGGFHLDAVKVTDANMESLARLLRGKVKTVGFAQDHDSFIEFPTLDGVQTVYKNQLVQVIDTDEKFEVKVWDARYFTEA